jgi:hypothetical protein
MHRLPVNYDRSIVFSEYFSLINLNVVLFIFVLCRGHPIFAVSLDWLFLIAPSTGYLHVLYIWNIVQDDCKQLNTKSLTFMFNYNKRMFSIINGFVCCRQKNSIVVDFKYLYCFNK